MAASVARHIARISCKRAFVSQFCRSNHVNIPRRHLSVSPILKDRFFAETHEWVSIENGKGTVGISNYAQEQLGEIVYAELPEVGSTPEPKDVVALLESVKAASDIYSPVGGVVKEVNSKLTEKPDLVNTSPFEEGWIFKLDLAPGTSTDGLMDEAAYKKYISSLE